MTRHGAENNFDDSYTLEQLVLANSGWKVVYNINGKYSIEYIIAYAFIRNGLYWELIFITPQELHLVQSLQEYVLKDGYVGMITPDNKLLPCEDTVEDNEHIDVSAIKKALRKTIIDLEVEDV